MALKPFLFNHSFAAYFMPESCNKIMGTVVYSLVKIAAILIAGGNGH